MDARPKRFTYPMVDSRVRFIPKVGFSKDTPFLDGPKFRTPEFDSRIGENPHRSLDNFTLLLVNMKFDDFLSWLSTVVLMLDRTFQFEGLNICGMESRLCYR